MASFLADENMTSEVVASTRSAGFDVAWVRELMPGASDDTIMARALADKRVIITCDKDFGEMAFRQGKDATAGILLLRMRLQSPDAVAKILLSALAQPIDWAGKFCVVQEGRIRVVPLPA